MSEPKQTVGRVATWRPIDAENVLFRAGLQDDHIRSQRAAGYVRAAMRELVRELNGRLAPPAPQPEARAEPDYTCPKCGAKNHHTPTYFSMCGCDPWAVLAAANARIAELVRELDEARLDAYEQGRRNGEAAGYAKGAAAAKEACARRLEREAALESLNFEHAIASHKIRCARLVRELDVNAPLTDADKRLQEHADKTWGPDA